MPRRFQERFGGALARVISGIAPALRGGAMASRGHAAPALAVLAVALGTRLYQLGEESLWIDEAISWGRASLGLEDLLADSVQRKHLPTYFVLLKAWMLVGDSEAMLRLPSVLFGTVSAVLAYFLGAALHG